MPKQVKIKLKTNEKDDFVGFEYRDETVAIYYPKTLILFEDNQEHDTLDYRSDKKAIKMLSVFMRSFRLADSKDNVVDSSPVDSKRDVLNYPIEAYQFMIDDYQRNGRYIEFEINYSINGNGKIDWKRTFNRTPVLINDQPTYIDVVTKQKHMVSNILNDIYLFCVYESIAKFGSWYLGMNSNIIPSKAKRLTSSQKKMYVDVIITKLHETFNDDTVNRLQNMLLIVSGAREDRGIQRMGLKRYNSVFERLIKWGLDNVGDLKKYNPRARWNNSEIKEAEDEEPLRLDALRIEDGKAYILDAKFYQSSRPGTADINKQITYGENLYVNCDNLCKNGPVYNKETICNVFVSPELPSRLNGEFILKSPLVADGGWRTNNKSYEKVHLLFVDLNKLLVAWNKNNRNDMLTSFNNIKAAL